MRFPVIHLLALKPYEVLRESPNPSLCSMFVELPDVYLGTKENNGFDVSRFYPLYPLQPCKTDFVFPVLVLALQASLSDLFKIW